MKMATNRLRVDQRTGMGLFLGLTRRVVPSTSGRSSAANGRVLQQIAVDSSD